MNLVDANILLYAVNEADAKHETSRRGLDAALNGREAVGFAWVVLLAFIRLSTKIGLFPDPLPVSEAMACVRDWTEQAPSFIPHPTPRHLALMSGLLADAGTGGNLVTDAHLAVLALEYDATIITYDGDYARFRGVRWLAPS
ncbi:MAG: type II toxin-antitoxin system VapC family toxin [Actinomycetota bacterium]